jgi:hypothetical protein
MTEGNKLNLRAPDADEAAGSEPGLTPETLARLDDHLDVVRDMAGQLGRDLRDLLQLIAVAELVVAGEAAGATLARACADYEHGSDTPRIGCRRVETIAAELRDVPPAPVRKAKETMRGLLSDMEDQLIEAECALAALDKLTEGTRYEGERRGDNYLAGKAQDAVGSLFQQWEKLRQAAGMPEV